MYRLFFSISIALLLFCQPAAAKDDSYIVNIKKSEFHTMGVKDNDDNTICFDSDCYILVNKEELKELILNDPNLLYEINHEIEIPELDIYNPSFEATEPAANYSNPNSYKEEWEGKFGAQWPYNKEFINYQKARDIIDPIPQVTSNPPIAVIIDSGFKLNKAIYGENNSYNLMESIEGDYCVNFSIINGKVTKTMGCIDYHNHGTAVAGVITAVADNTKYGSSFGKGKIYSINISQFSMNEKKYSFNGANILKAYEHIYNLKKAGHNIVVVNTSFSSPSDSIMSYRAIDKLKRVGIIVVASAGNTGRNSGTHPQFSAASALDNIIGAAAIDSYNQLASFSVWGKYTTLGAPGIEMISTFNVPNYETMEAIDEGDPRKVFLLQNDWAELKFDSDVCSITDDKLACTLKGNTKTVIKTPEMNLSSFGSDLFAYIKHVTTTNYSMQIDVGAYYGEDIFYYGRYGWFTIPYTSTLGIVVPIDNLKLADSQYNNVSLSVTIENKGSATDTISVEKITLANVNIVDAYKSFSGTSAAAPFIAGAILAANVIHPDITAEQTLNLLYKSATKLDPKESNFIQENRVIDLYAFFNEVQKCRNIPSSCDKYTRYPVKPGFLPNGKTVEGDESEDYEDESNNNEPNSKVDSSSSGKISGGCSIGYKNISSDKLFVLMLLFLSALFVRNLKRDR